MIFNVRQLNKIGFTLQSDSKNSQNQNSMTANPLTPKWDEKYRCLISRGERLLIDIDNGGHIFTAQKNPDSTWGTGTTAFDTPDGLIVVNNRTNTVIGKMSSVDNSVAIQTVDCSATAGIIVSNKADCQSVSVEIPANEIHSIQTDDCLTSTTSGATPLPEEEATDSRLEQLAKELNLQTTKLASQKQQLLGVGYHFADLKEGSSTALLLVDSLSSKLSEIKKSLEADQEFIDRTEQFCEFSRVELLQRLCLNSQVIDNLQKTNNNALEDLRQREKDYSDLLYRFKFLAKVFANVLNNPERLEKHCDSAKRLDPIFDDENFDWKEVEYRFYKMVREDPGIESSPNFPVKADWKVKPRRS
jgi:hypothetical protein